MLEIRVMLDELLDRTGGLRPAGRASRIRSNFTNGLKRLPVKGIN